MLGYIIRRLLVLPVILWIIYTITFVLISLHPGSPFVDEKTPAEQIPLMERRLGIHVRPPPAPDEPPPAAWEVWHDRWLTYKTFTTRLILHGDLGLSSKYANRTVNDIISSSLPRSMLLGAFALVVAVVVGCTLGIVAAVKSHGLVDYAVMLYALLGISLPLFVIGALVLGFFAFTLGWFPIGGWGRPSQLILPGLTLSLPFTAYIARLMRAGMLDVLHSDHIRTARAKGLPQRQVILKHAFKQAFLPVLSFLGPATANILTGSFVVEWIFNVPGIGRAFVESVNSKDYALILGAVLVYSTLLILANLFVDVAYTWVDPRIRLEGED